MSLVVTVRITFTPGEDGQNTVEFRGDFEGGLPDVNSDAIGKELSCFLVAMGEAWLKQFAGPPATVQ